MIGETVVALAPFGERAATLISAAGFAGARRA
jgi:hypothetical protein